MKNFISKLALKGIRICGKYYFRYNPFAHKITIYENGLMSVSEEPATKTNTKPNVGLN